MNDNLTRNQTYYQLTAMDYWNPLWSLRFDEALKNGAIMRTRLPDEQGKYQYAIYREPVNDTSIQVYIYIPETEAGLKIVYKEDYDYCFGPGDYIPYLDIIEFDTEENEN
jgi:hypothetical protein